MGAGTMTPLISIVTMAGGGLEHVFFLSPMNLGQQRQKPAKELSLWRLLVTTRWGGSLWDGRQPLGPTFLQMVFTPSNSSFFTSPSDF